MSSDNNAQEISITLETATSWARSNREWEKVYRYLFLHPKDFFVISPGRRWPIAHQVVYHGDVDLLKRILVLFSNDQIDIRTKSADDKTLLTVATEKRNAHPLMYTYVEHLFAQDELMNEAKNSNWRLVTDLLGQNKDLANEKPPYSPYFLLHYVVENGDAYILQDLLDHFQLLTNVLNNKNETPLDMAVRLNKHDMCSILRPKTITGLPFTHNQPETPTSAPVHRPEEQATSQKPIKPSNEPPKYQSQTSMPTPPPKSIDPGTKLPCIGFGAIVLDISQTGDFTVGPPSLYNSTRSSPPSVTPPAKQYKQSLSSSGISHVQTRKTIVSEYPSTDLDPPPPPPPAPSKASASSNQQVMRNLTCTLTQEIFVDPVIATDGQTYERSAILDWVKQYHCSPTTGAPMDATFRDNTEIKAIIQSIRQQS